MLLRNPYRPEPLPWMKGNLHTHTTNSDGNRSPQDTVDAYRNLGYDFLMLSDHDRFTDPIDLEEGNMLLLPGNEITAYGPHVLHVNAHRCIRPDRDRQAIINAIERDGGFSIICHPNWEKHYNHCDQKDLERWQGYTGIEIYNGVCRRVEGSPFATDRWDRLLTAGRRVWGYACDDNHEDQDRGVAWTVAQVDKQSIAAVVAALREGRCYASTGVAIDSIRVNGHTVQIEAAGVQCYHVCSEHGRVLARIAEPQLSYTIPRDFDCAYVRIECYGEGDAMAWTQPFYVEQG